MRRFFFARVVFISISASAYPSFYSCDHACMASKSPGDAFGSMGVPNFEMAMDSNCAISTNIPADGYAAGQNYDVTVTSTLDLGMKLACDQGAFAGKKGVDTATSFKGKTTTHTWTADSAASVTFRAMCGSGGSTDKVFLASAVVVQKSGSTGTLATDDVTTTSAVLATTTVAETNSQSSEISENAVQLLPGMFLSTSIENNNVDIKVVMNRNTWIAIGFAAGELATMTGGGDGVDLFACTDGGAVKRYWQTDYSTPSNLQEEVGGSSCARVSGQTTMLFRRPASRRLNSVPIRLGTQQPVTFAHGNDGRTSFQQHATDARGGKLIDLKTLAVSDAPKKGGEAALYAHLICMILAWGAFLPWGVALANRTREYLGYSPGLWLKLHKSFQITGWFVQIVGFSMAIWHVSDNIGGDQHLRNAHGIFGTIIVVLGSLQPLNAVIRPHKPAQGEAKTMVRLIWEIMHKGLGYLALACGILQLWSGVNQLNEQGYDNKSKIISIALALTGLIPVFIYVIIALSMSVCCGGNKTSSKSTSGNGSSAKVTNVAQDSIGATDDSRNC